MRLLIAGILSLAPTWAIAVEFTARTPDLETYLALISATEADLADTCAALTAEAPSAGQAWLRIGDRGLELAPNEARSAEAAAFWAEFALGAWQAARALYGQAAGRAFISGPVLIEINGDAATIFDGEARSGGDLCAAMTRLVGVMGGAAASPFATARDTLSRPIAPVAIGGETQIELESSYSPDTILRGPDGVAAIIGEDGATIALSATADATIGDSALRIYAQGDPFKPIDEIPITILPGADTPLPQRQIGALTVGGAFSGDLPMGGVVELDISLKDARRLTVAGTTNADLKVEILSKSGVGVAADDDSGDGYGFSISANLPAGAYVVKVTHCCGGGGAFVVSATSE